MTLDEALDLKSEIAAEQFRLREADQEVDRVLEEYLVLAHVKVWRVSEHEVQVVLYSYDADRRRMH